MVRYLRRSLQREVVGVLADHVLKGAGHEEESPRYGL